MKKLLIGIIAISSLTSLSVFADPCGYGLKGTNREWSQGNEDRKASIDKIMSERGYEKMFHKSDTQYEMELSSGRISGEFTLIDKSGLREKIQTWQFNVRPDGTSSNANALFAKILGSLPNCRR